MCVHTTEAFFQKSTATEAPDLPVCDDRELFKQQETFMWKAQTNQLVLKALQCHFVAEENITFQ